VRGLTLDFRLGFVSSLWRNVCHFKIETRNAHGFQCSGNHGSIWRLSLPNLRGKLCMCYKIILGVKLGLMMMTSIAKNHLSKHVSFKKKMKNTIFLFCFYNLHKLFHTVKKKHVFFFYHLFIAKNLRFPPPNETYSRCEIISNDKE
jgi:hypothetical protein